MVQGALEAVRGSIQKPNLRLIRGLAAKLFTPTGVRPKGFDTMPSAGSGATRNASSSSTCGVTPTPKADRQAEADAHRRREADRRRRRTPEPTTPVRSRPWRPRPRPSSAPSTRGRHRAVGRLEGSRVRRSRLPDPCLVVLVGAAGSGKSTFAARRFGPDDVLSSDAFRALIGAMRRTSRQPARPSRPSIGPSRAGLGEGRLTVVDATNVSPTLSRVLLRARTAGLPAIAIVLDVPAAEALARNAARLDRVVPDAVVHRQLLDLDLALRTGRLETEGFSLVVRLRGPAADGVRIRRVSR